jgi:hypothetical protein
VKKARKEKVPFTLDFNVDPPLSKEELFQPAPTKSSILLPGSTTAAKKGSRKSAQTKEDKEDYTLPDDYQFNSNVLLRLFLKPKTTVRASFSFFSFLTELLRAAVVCLPHSSRCAGEDRQLSLRTEATQQPKTSLSGLRLELQEPVELLKRE